MSTTTRRTRSGDHVWLIGQPMETIKGARLPSGQDVMRNFIYFHRFQKHTIHQSAVLVYNQIVPFWEKSGLPIRDKQHVLKQIKDLYGKQVSLMRNRKRSNAKDQENQRIYCDNLNKLFDISHANSQELLKNEEDRQFLQLQRNSRTGCIGSLDKKLAEREKKKQEKNERFAKRLQATLTTASTPTTSYVIAENENAMVLDIDEANKSSEESSDEEFTVKIHSDANTKPKGNKSKLCGRRSIISPRVAAVLDRSNTSIRRSTMIIASIINEEGCSSSTMTCDPPIKSIVLSKSTVHRERQRLRRETAEQLKTQFEASKSVVHWDGKLLPDLSPKSTGKIDRLAVLVSSLQDKSTKLLGVPKLLSGTGKEAADAVFELLQSWNCESEVIGMCFDTTTTNSGRFKGACTLLEQKIGRNLLWIACRHHMFEVLLSDAFSVCFGQSTGPEILLFKRFRDNWSKLNHHEPRKQSVPIITASDSLKTFISDQLKIATKLPRDDYRELLNLAALMIGLDIQFTIRKPGALHRARWMAKAIYTLKMELLFNGNEATMVLTAGEFQGMQRFNRFVVSVYLQSWFTCRSAADAPPNDVLLVQRLKEYDDKQLSNKGLKMMLRHSWYLSGELATLTLFSDLVSDEQKSKLVLNMKKERRSSSHLLEILPLKLDDLCISYSFFETAKLENSFLSVPVKDWPETPSYKKAAIFAKNLTCVNDVAEQAVALIQDFNYATKSEEQKQFLLQVVEMHRKNFAKCNRQNLLEM